MPRAADFLAQYRPGAAAAATPPAPVAPRPTASQFLAQFKPTPPPEDVSFGEQLLDLARAAGQQSLEFGGSALRGLAELETATSNLLAPVGRELGFSEEDLAPIPNEESWFYQAGEWLSGGAEDIAVPPERETIGTDIVGGVGQLASQIATYVTNPTLGAATLFGVGADTQAQRADEAGVSGPVRDLAVLSGAGITAATEAIGTEVLLNRLVPGVTNRLVNRLVDIAIAGGAEAAQEAAEQAAQDILTQVTTNPEQPFLEDIGRQMTAAGGAAGIARGLLTLALPRLRQRGDEEAAPTAETPGAQPTAPTPPPTFTPGMAVVGTQAGVSVPGTVLATRNVSGTTMVDITTGETDEAGQPITYAFPSNRVSRTPTGNELPQVAPVPPPTPGVQPAAAQPPIVPPVAVSAPQQAPVVPVPPVAPAPVGQTQPVGQPPSPVAPPSPQAPYQPVTFRPEVGTSAQQREIIQAVRVEAAKAGIQTAKPNMVSLVALNPSPQIDAQLSAILEREIAKRFPETPPVITPAAQAKPVAPEVPRLPEPEVTPAEIERYSPVTKTGDKTTLTLREPEPPLAKGMRRVYQMAGNRYAADPELAEWYAQETGQPSAKFVDIPEPVAAQSRISVAAPQLVSTSRDAENEFVLPEEYAGQVQPVTWRPPVQPAKPAPVTKKGRKPKAKSTIVSRETSPVPPVEFDAAAEQEKPAEARKPAEPTDDEIVAAVRAELDKRGLKRVGVRLRQALASDSTAHAAYWRGTVTMFRHPGKKLTEYTSDARHEALHAFKRLGAVTDAEWKILRRQATAKWRKRYKTDSVYRAELEKANPKATPAQIEALLDEEAIAEALRDYLDGKLDAQGVIKRILEKIKAVLEAIANAYRGQGLRSTTGIMRDMGTGKLAKRLPETTEPAADEQPALHRVYHGSKSKHRAFSLQKIGSGEGTQAFGWGLYFADRRGVAEYYRELGRSSSVVKNVTYNGSPNGGFKPGSVEDTVMRDIMRSIRLYGKTPREAIDFELSTFIRVKEATPDPDTVRFWEKVGRSDFNRDKYFDDRINFLRSLDARKFKYDKPGYLYQIDLAPKVEDYLDWDKTLGELAPDTMAKVQAVAEEWGVGEARSMYRLEGKVSWFNNQVASIITYYHKKQGQYLTSLYPLLDNMYEAIAQNKQRQDVAYAAKKVAGYMREVMKLIPADAAGQFPWFGQMTEVIREVEAFAGPENGKYFDPAMTGERFYRVLSNRIGSEMEASMTLLQAGVPGIRFLDRGSRDKGEGTHNYVIFDDSLVTIEAVNDQPYESVMFARRNRLTGLNTSERRDFEQVIQSENTLTLPETVRYRAAWIRKFGLRWLVKNVANKDLFVAELEKSRNFGKLMNAAASAFKFLAMARNLQGPVGGAILREMPGSIQFDVAKGMVTTRTGKINITSIDGTSKDVELQPLERGLDPVSRRGSKFLNRWKMWAVAKRFEWALADGRGRWVEDPNGPFTKGKQTGWYAMGNFDSHDEQQAWIDRWKNADTDPDNMVDGKNVFVEAHDNWIALQKSVLDFAEVTGLINQQQRATWERGDYMPLYRVIEQSSIAPFSKEQIANQRSGIFRLEGSRAVIGDPLENMTLNISHLIAAGMRNEAMNRVYDLGVQAGMIRDVSAPMRKMLVAASSAAAALRAQGINVDALGPISGSFIEATVMTGKTSDPTVQSMMVAGKVHWLQVNEPELLEVIVNMRPRERNFLWRLLGLTKTILTKGVTITPAFMLRNVLRDTLHTSVVTGIPNAFGLKVMKNVVHNLRLDPDLIELSVAGGLPIGFYEGGPIAVRNRIERAGRKSRAYSPTTWWRAWQKFGAAYENANRLLIYRDVRKRLGAAEGAYQALDILDFSAHGSNRFVQDLIFITPFLNARIQGLYRLGRGIKENPTRFLIRGGVLSILTLLLAQLNDDDERYEELEQWEKDTYWHVWLDNIFPADLLTSLGIPSDTVISIPTPFEVGAMFATVPNRLMRLAKGDDSWRVTRDSMIAMITGTFALDMPQGIKPVIEQVANKIFFLDRPIVSQNLEDLEEEAQYTTRTSGTARLISEVAPDWLGGWINSPVRIEHLIRGYLGGSGTLLLASADVFAEPLMDLPPEPTRRPFEFVIPVIDSFVSSGEPYSTHYMTDFYDIREEIERAHLTYEAYRRNGNIAAAMRVAEEDADLLAQRNNVNRVYRGLSRINRQIREVELSRAYSPDQKRRMLDNLLRQRNSAAAQVSPILSALGR